MYEHVKTGCKYIPTSEQPPQFQSGYYLNKPRIYCAVLRLTYSIAFDCSIRPFLAPFHSSLYISHLSPIALYISSLTHRCIYPISHPSQYISHLSPIAVYIPSITHRCIYPIYHPSLYISHPSPITVYIPSPTHRSKYPIFPDSSGKDTFLFFRLPVNHNLVMVLGLLGLFSRHDYNK